MKNLSRRGFLSGLLSSAAIVAAGPVAKIVPPLPDRFEVYTSHFKWQKEIISRDWKFVARAVYINSEVAPVEFSGFVPAWSDPLDLFKAMEGASA